MAQANAQTLTPEDQMAMAGRYRSAKMEQEKSAEEEQPKSLRQAVMSARRAEQRKGLKQKAMDTAAAPIRFGTNWALRHAWWSILYTGGISIILSFIYLHIHVFLRFVLGEKLFCKLGDEWLPKKARAAMGGAGELGSKGAGIIERGALLMIDILLLTGLLIIISFFVIIFGIVLGLFDWCPDII